MQRNYRLIISIIALSVSSLCAFAQEEVEYKDVFLDGKPAKLNVATGEVTLVKADVKSTKTETNSENNNPSLVTNNHVINVSNGTATDHVDTSDFYSAKEGETLFDISKKYNVTLNQLKRANNLETTLINKGQILRVKNLHLATTSSSQYKSTDNSYSDADTSNFHIVKKGETLFSLAKHYGLNLNELKTLNNLSSNLIVPDQRLRVDGFSVSENLDNASVWIVQKGDNLYRIALSNGTTVDAIKRLNGLTSNTIKIGQKLLLR